MTTPLVIEITRALEPVSADTFIDRPAQAPPIADRRSLSAGSRPRLAAIQPRRGARIGVRRFARAAAA